MELRHFTCISMGAAFGVVRPYIFIAIHIMYLIVKFKYPCFSHVRRAAPLSQQTQDVHPMLF